MSTDGLPSDRVLIAGATCGNPGPKVRFPSPEVQPQSSLSDGNETSRKAQCPPESHVAKFGIRGCLSGPLNSRRYSRTVEMESRHQAHQCRNNAGVWVGQGCNSKRLRAVEGSSNRTPLAAENACQAAERLYLKGENREVLEYSSDAQHLVQFGTLSRSSVDAKWLLRHL